MTNRPIAGVDLVVRLRSFSRILPAFLVAAIGSVLGALCGGTAVAQSAGEYQVKAVFVQNFARFVEWPPGTFTDARDPFTICVLGEDPFHGELELAVKGRTVNDRAFVIKRGPKAQDAGSCQIIFVSTSERKHLTMLLGNLHVQGVLTVGDTDDFVEAGGIINLALEDGRIKCEINTDAAERAHLKISSKLLGVARLVKGPRKG